MWFVTEQDEDEVRARLALAVHDLAARIEPGYNQLDTYVRDSTWAENEERS